jgi:hypothetical protein
MTESEVAGKVGTAGARAYLWIALGTFALFCIAGVTGLWFAAGVGPTESSSSSARHIYFWQQKKAEILAHAKGSRLLLVGGSGVLYSLRASDLERDLGGPVINFGLHAGLGLDYLLSRVERAARPGDVVVLFLEYGLYVDPTPGWTLADFAIPYDLRYLAQVSPADVLAIAGKLTLREYLEKLTARIVQRPIDGSQFRAMLNDQGDLIENLRSRQQPHHRDSLATFSTPFAGTKVNPIQAARLRSFLVWSRSHGVTVIAGFPAFLDFGEYAQRPYRAFYDEIAAFYSGEGILSLGEPQEFFVKREHFFDTNYHLNDEGATQFTNKVRQRLEGALVCSLPTRWDPTNRQTCQVDNRRITVDFSEAGTPQGTSALKGFAEAESWGRWTDGEKVAIVFRSALPRRFRLEMFASHVFSPGRPLVVGLALGSLSQQIRFGDDSRVAIELENPALRNELELTLPAQPSPKALGLSNDDRHLGLGLSRIVITPMQ